MPCVDAVRLDHIGICVVIVIVVADFSHTLVRHMRAKIVAEAVVYFSKGFGPCRSIQSILIDNTRYRQKIHPIIVERLSVQF